MVSNTRRRCRSIEYSTPLLTCTIRRNVVAVGSGLMIVTAKLPSKVPTMIEDAGIPQAVALAGRDRAVSAQPIDNPVLDLPGS